MRKWLVALVATMAMATACAGDGGEKSAAPRKIAFLRAVASGDVRSQEVLLTTLANAGYRRGRNLTVLGGDPAEVHRDPPDIATTVKRWKADGVDIIIALSSSGAAAAAAAAPDVDVLFLSNDPMATGLVKNERRPEGKLTGSTFRVPADRSLVLARRVLPSVTKVGYVYPPDDPAAPPHRDNVQRASTALGIDLVVEPFAAPADIPGAFDRVAAAGAGMLFLSNSPTTVRNFPAIETALGQHPLPVLANTSASFALVVLEPDVPTLYQQMGRQAVRLLKGTPAAQVPVEDPNRFRVVLNQKVADRLGVVLPPAVIADADEVIK